MVLRCWLLASGPGCRGVAARGGVTAEGASYRNGGALAEAVEVSGQASQLCSEVKMRFELVEEKMPMIPYPCPWAVGPVAVGQVTTARSHSPSRSLPRTPPPPLQLRSLWRRGAKFVHGQKKKMTSALVQVDT